jgi:diacylglycerol kinase family enzyme
MTFIPRYLFIHDAHTESLRMKDAIVRHLKEADMGVEYDFYAASSSEDALRHVSLYCDLHPDLDTCFVACASDALTSGVAAGLMGAGEGKTLAVFDPEGSNSLARYYEGRDFGSLPELFAGTPVGIDMIRVNDSYAVNACSFGLEDLTAGQGLLQSVSAVLRRSFRSVRITADGLPLDTGTVLLFTLANGKYTSGGTMRFPSAVNDDGKLDLCIVRNMPPSRLRKVLPLLADGRIADEPSLTGDLILRRAGTLGIESAKDITISVDGCPLTGREFKVKVVPSAVRMVIPAKTIEMQ